MWGKAASRVTGSRGKGLCNLINDRQNVSHSTQRQNWNRLSYRVVWWVDSGRSRLREKSKREHVTVGTWYKGHQSKKAALK